MANVFRLRKGLDINLKGKAVKKKVNCRASKVYALRPSDFTGITPKVVVKEGDRVLAGDALFVNKQFPEVLFASPVSGTVKSVVRGERRRVLSVSVEADEKQEFRDFGAHNVNEMDGEAVKQLLLEAGLFGYINQLPYAVSTHPGTSPKGIFVSALRDMPLAADFEYELEGNEEAFKTGLKALNRIAPLHLGVGANQTADALQNVEDVDLNVFDGPCPAGNVGVQVNHVDPVNRGEVVWTVDPTAVIFIGRLLLTGKVDLHKTIAIAGSQVNDPAYADVLVGAQLADVLDGKLSKTDHVRLINGNPLTGERATLDDFVGAHTSELTAIPEGDDKEEILGWILPRLNDFSVSRSYFSWLEGKKHEYDLDARVKGGKRHMIMSGEYDKVVPMDIYPEYLVKAIITGDIDKQEQLGIYEVSPEDFALAEFVDSSKLELQKIVRQGLDTLRKENA
ncbi:MAG TPA: NADH:ubiquinone reductase (Na(+)-transporting) subunit A [Prevotella sp.]|nr:NADH:ubiquinone reductase (Na(+)-transporting) subunit A [Prevotella sp.]